ncbi:aldo/keto reductase [Colletotrichum graminicola M1.001]|uniref:Aldo/keto reductase n=1 Tax=Colletotrichum graminicola (strain M1.001 / M2 / FGSC 10212) TaxID=645133 RepID=E3QJU6_COLGM|nr:aldo/keto reductase [Colletotrichum graminicola M1.001]EFQ31134.1 aldo/keto reductase [Colletotrichum graminicola M1.001]
MAPPVCTKTFKLNNGLDFPAVGLGTWQGKQAPLRTDDSKALEESIIHALKVGYRHIDTAQLYGVEEVVGRAIRNSGVPRSEIIVVTKFWGNWHHDPAKALQISLDTLGLDYIDVFLMHWPWATTPAPEMKVLKKWESPTFIETWKMMEPLVGEKCRAIGVSNFMPKVMDELLAEAKIVPAINQVELHAFNPNLNLVPYCQEKGIVVTSWSTLGGSSAAQNEILTHELFTSIAKAHDVSTGVVSLSWAVQRGIAVIPKSANKARIEENIRLVTLTDEEMRKINEAHKTIKRERLSNNIASQHMEIDGKMTQQGWTYVDMGYEDENGNWLA